jgi:hypothetical protein
MLKLLIGLEHVPLTRLVLGAVCAWLLTLGIPYYLAVTPAFDDEPRMIVEAELAGAAVLRSGNENVLDFALRDQPVRFRVETEVFKKHLRGRIPSEFQEGALVRVEVFSSEYRDPYLPVPYRVPTAYVRSIGIGGVEILPLAISWRHHEDNRRYAWYLLALAASASVMLSWGTWVKLGHGKGRLAELVR